jgi:hypothetical protein
MPARKASLLVTNAPERVGVEKPFDELWIGVKV